MSIKEIESMLRNSTSSNRPSSPIQHWLGFIFLSIKKKQYTIKTPSENRRKGGKSGIIFGRQHNPQTKLCSKYHKKIEVYTDVTHEPKQKLFNQNTDYPFFIIHRFHIYEFFYLSKIFGIPKSVLGDFIVICRWAQNSKKFEWPDAHVPG